jgi:hypothetical protein
MSSAQWAHLGPDELLVATAGGAWIQRREPGAMWLDGPMPPALPGTPQTMRHLLDGAMAAAERSAPRPTGLPAMTQRRWAWQLAGQWHTSYHSIPLIAEVAERFDEEGRRELAEYTWRKFDEERGHDQLALTDLRELGYDGEPLARAATPPVAAAAVDYAYRRARGAHPVEFLGYVHVIERDVIRLTDDWFSALDAVLPPGVDAAFGLRSHATDLDLEHVDQAFEFFAGLPADDRTRIALACHRTAQILYTALPGQHPSETELKRRLTPFQLTTTKEHQHEH